MAKAKRQATPMQPQTPVQPAEETAAQQIQQYAMAVDPESAPPAAEPDTVEIPVQEPVRQDPPADPPKPKHSQRLLLRAKEAGLSEEVVNALSSEDLRDEIAYTRERQSDMRQVQQAINAAGRPYDPATGQLLPVKPAEPEVPKDVLAEIGFDLKKYGDVAPETLDMLRDLIAPIWKEVKEAKGGVNEVREWEKGRRQQENLTQLDKLFSMHKNVFGEGSRDDLDPGSDEYRRRAMVAREMDANMQAEPGISIKKNFEKASKAILGLAATVAPKAPEPVVDDKGYKNGSTIKPTTHRFADLKPGRDKALAGVDDWMNAQEEESAAAPPELPK